MVALANLGAADQALPKAPGDALPEGARRAGRHIVCRLACTECRLGPFPITRLDAWRLRRGLAELSSRDPPAAARARERSRTALRRMPPEFPSDAESGLLVGGEERQEEFFARHAARPCPALNPVSGACEL